MKLTSRQAVVLDAIKEFYEREKIMPTTRDIAARLGCAQSAINLHLYQLDKKGVIRRQRRTARAIVLIDRSEWPKDLVVA